MMEVYKTLNDSTIVFINTAKGLNYVENVVIDTVVKRLSNELDFTVHGNERKVQRFGNESDVETTSAGSCI